MYFLLRFVPKNHLSFLVGKIAELRLPRCVLMPLLRWFSSCYGVRVEEASESLQSYSTLGGFFVRDLAPGSRPIGEGIVSPVDGKLTEFGTIEDGLAVQVKGKKYSIRELLRDESLAECFDGGTYLTLYLAPGDYHHIHAPVEGRVTDSYHIEGKLWPVNSWSLNSIDNLFSTNERVTTVIENEACAKLAVVKVGATNVGSIRLAYDDSVRGNRSPAFFKEQTQCHHQHYSEPIDVAKGQRIGSFYLGSTVVVLFERGRFTPGEACVPGKVLLGTTLGFPSSVG